MEQKRRPLLVAFCIPVAVMIAAVIYKEIYPFGDRCFLRVDMYNQYMPFFAELHRKMREGGSLFFSWRAGLGANFLALYAYYMASPVNWLLFFCPRDYIIEFMTALIIVKIGLCGVSFAWYLKRHFGTDRYAVSLFAVFYALSGYLAAYNWNIMWLDCIILAPVIILGLEELVRERKPVRYCLALGVSILTNYYISIFICIFLVLYYVILAIPLSVREKGRSLRDFVLYSLLAGGLSGVVMVPGTLALGGTRFDQPNFPHEIRFYFPVLKSVIRHCVNVMPEIRSAHLPNIYCGVAVFLLLPVYLCSRGISWKEKLPRLLLLGFFHLSFSVNILDFFWHGLNFPDSLPARQSFLYIFLILTLSFEGFLHFREISWRWLGFIVTCVILFLLTCQRVIREDDFKRGSFAFTMLYFFLYALLLYWYEKGSLRKNLAVSLLTLLAITEAAMNTIETSIFTTSRSRYCAHVQSASALLEYLNLSETDFCRIEQYDRMTKNDGMLAGFPTATLFSSTTNEAVAHYYRRLGMSTSKVFYSYEGATPLASALLSVDYMLSDELEGADAFHELLAEGEDGYLYRNQYTLPLGFVIDAGMEERWNMEEGNPIEVQNDLAKALGIPEPLFDPVEVTCEGGEAYITVEEEGYIYIWPEKCSTKNITAQAGGLEKTYEKVYYPHILDIGWCDAGSMVALTQSGDKRNDKNELAAVAYRINVSVLDEMIGLLGNYPMEVEAVSDTSVAGIVHTDREGMLVTSIPGEAGWHVSVDGRASGIHLFGGAMIGVAVPAGSHRVVFTYTPPGLGAGLTMSAVSALLLIVLCRYRGRRAQRGAP